MSGRPDSKISRTVLAARLSTGWGDEVCMAEWCSLLLWRMPPPQARRASIIMAKAGKEMKVMRVALWLGLLSALVAAAPAPPDLMRVYPLGGQAGTTVSLEILGERLANATGVEFDCRDLV